MMKPTSLAAIAGLGALILGATQHARAADLVVARPLLTWDSTWTGFYGGINVGGFAATGTARWGATGIEGDITNNHTSAKNIQYWTAFGTNAAFTGSSVPEIRTLEWLGTLRARFGYLLTARTLVYATGGVAWSGVNYAASSTGPIGPGYVSSVSFTETEIG
jgi:opacity protein-like surface antigen